LSIVLGFLILTFLYGCQDQQGKSRSSETTAQHRASEEARQTQGGDLGEAQGGLNPKIEKIMNSSPYRDSEWALLEVDPKDGHVVNSLNSPKRFFIPGSTAKLFSVSAALDDLGFNHRFKTPVYARGSVKDGTLSGNLVLVAKGDLTMGGRTKPDGTVAFTDVDHTYANDVPGATLTPENPLAGLDRIAQQVRKSGITQVNGNVIIDDRLFKVIKTPPNPLTDLDPWPSPITINDNLIDVQITPGKVGKAPKVVRWRPHVAPYHLDVQAKTVSPDKPTTLSVSTESDGRIVLSGDIAANAGKLLRVASIENPPSFARTALIEALKREGVSVSASSTGPNPSSKLPKKGSYKADDQVAAYTSPPFREYAKLILKISHNYGANLNICLMAVKAGSTDCDDGFSTFRSFLGKANVDTDQVAFSDGRGGNPTDRFTPQAAIELLRYWLRQPQAKTFRLMLPVMGVDGGLAKTCTGCPAKGKVFAKTGTVALPDLVNNRLVLSWSYGGYLEAGPGKFYPYYLVVNGAVAQDVPSGLKQYNELGTISSILQQEASHEK
jgi:D-alanyl-D-alanine carboxypeptidase/D-alanyl-D-alanine-endopeptidase (penicillin-binding protein 4)